jgi:hexosaminidase
MRELGIADETALQLYFVRRVEALLAQRGKRLIGWDEILDEGLPARATVMSWRGRDGAIRAARAGHDVVMAPAPDLYFDHLQSTLADEPPGRPTPITLAAVYAYEPLPAELDAAAAAHVLGAQANLWTEHMRTFARVEHAAFPRLAALAERLWSPPAQRDFAGFVTRLLPQLERYRRDGIDYADSAFAVHAELAPGSDGRVEVYLHNQLELGTLRYTLDGREPTAASPRYEAPFMLTPPITLRATAYLGTTALAAPRTRVIARDWQAHRRGDELEPCRRELLLRLEDDAPLAGPRAVHTVDILDPCWLWRAAPLDGHTRLQARVGQLPYNFELWHDAAKIVRRAPASPSGELLARLDRCDGPIVASLPLATAVARPALTELTGALVPTAGTHDVCFTFTGQGPDPLWVIDALRLRPGAE